jgi:hypothetical protein
MDFFKVLLLENGSNLHKGERRSPFKNIFVFAPSWAIYLKRFVTFMISFFIPFANENDENKNHAMLRMRLFNVEDIM